MKALLDTSVFIALESGRRIEESKLPEEMYLSVITLGELHAGVLAAKDTEIRARRLATVESLARFEVLPVNADAARHWARLRFRLYEAGRKVNVNDLWIASVALAYGMPVATQDKDYEVLAGMDGPLIVQL
ncbi:type II toxin-antitoxin system VapC family toxin [Arthrobacter sp. H14]|uniref:type II toxin-antitoxin system VapC family toxin n=1 Tax=Arthrobacter sp. H14 TaxID=1312959 RepID=UPI0004B9D892|nr:type II toxin-antitoxin system VapC family toxin [Arthrobacter sp. H14]